MKRRIALAGLLSAPLAAREACAQDEWISILDSHPKAQAVIGEPGSSFYVRFDRPIHWFGRVIESIAGLVNRRLGRTGGPTVDGIVRQRAFHIGAVLVEIGRAPDGGCDACGGRCVAALLHRP